jgi:DNA-binding MarR family transcriptional regulator/N-acetylglutamate synthase-like GNAT family acetyltransferase
MSIDEPAAASAIRHFNRFYTRQIGVLREHLLESRFSLVQVRVLYELAQRDNLAAVVLGKELGLDAGYLSRILSGFEKLGLLTRTRSKSDGRQSELRLTEAGREAFRPLDERSSREADEMLGRLAPPDQQRLVGAMQTIEALLGEPKAERATFFLRPHQPGDMGWVVHRHGALYAQEYGWDQTMEALVAEIVARFIRKFDEKRERCWIAERDGETVGSVFLVKQSTRVAKLRLLLVEPKARGLGIGNRLVAECIRFARQAGYRKITLWTNDVLAAARHIYEKAGFKLAHQQRHRSFGHDLVGQNWELEL